MRFGLLLSCALVASAAAAPRAGKVIRVERRSAGLDGQPRFCGLQPSDMQGNCYGLRAPEVGERLVVVDRNRVVGSVRVGTVQGYADSCNQTTNWMITTVADGADLQPSRGYVLAFADVDLDVRSARLIDVGDKTPTGHAWGVDQIYAIDNNGDGSADIEFIQFACDDFGNPSNTASGQCQEVWVAQGGTKQLARIRQDHFRTCY